MTVQLQTCCPNLFLRKIGLVDTDLKPHIVVLTNYEGTTGNSLGVVKVELIVGSVSRTTMFMVVPSKANFNVLLGREWIHGVGAVPSMLHQRIAIWRGDGLWRTLRQTKIISWLR